MLYSIQEIAKICDGRIIGKNSSLLIKNFITDSRKSIKENSIFIALKGDRFDGHDFIEDQLKKGVRIFLIQDDSYIIDSDKNVWVLVEDTLTALQKIATYHRSSNKADVIGITGSYGKTIVKEWLFQLMSPDFYVVKSPKSYNSQLGVPLSVLQLHTNHQYALFEAGISQANEMDKLEKIIRPDIGIFTALGDAHAEGFESKTHKLKEKFKLFKDSRVIICQNKPEWIKLLEEINPNAELVTWHIDGNQLEIAGTNYVLPVKPQPFFKENIASCIALLNYIGVEKDEIIKRVNTLETLSMRLEIMDGKLGSLILNDSYANDLAGLSIAMDYALETAPQRQLVLVLSEFVQTGLEEGELSVKILDTLSSYRLDTLVLIGSFYKKYSKLFNSVARNAYFFDSTAQLFNEFDINLIKEKTIVVKGARKYHLEDFVERIKDKSHQTIWEINLSDLIENLNYFKSKLNPGVKILAMVKATAYGTEANKVAQTLQYQGVDYLGVAYPEEGVSLRTQGITMPILVMNTSFSQFRTAVQSRLEIQLYSLNQAKEFINYCKQNGVLNYPVHLKVETGMNRLGFTEKELPELFKLLGNNKSIISIKGILSHLATANEDTHKAFTLDQVEKFKKLANQLLPYCTEKPLLHLLNSAGIEDSELPQFDMVRLGIGLHGISTGKAKNDLKQVGSLISRISQIKEITKGESVGYGRNFFAEEDKKIAIISIGYADGYDRRLGNGIGEVLVHGVTAPTVGSICMDMTMIDITHIPMANVGDQVILTNADLPIIELSAKIDTIAYELLTSISTRVQRKFVYE